MRGLNAHDSVETVVAAANAIAAAESRVQPDSVPRRRWKAWFGMYWCFGSHGQQNRISQAVLVPEPRAEGPNAPTLANSNQSSGQVVAPPSSPSSFFQSEPPSTTQSPSKFFSLSTLAANSYSPTRSSIFAIGPYADDTKLVSPPFFSTFTTEPSTAPFTPPEPVQQTTPSSPEVPFAHLLSSSFDSKRKREAYDFQPYQFHPGSPVGHLISPGSVCSGTSSPFPDMELHSSADDSILSFTISQPPKISTAEDLTMRKLLNGRAARDNGSILDGQITSIQPDVDDSRSVRANSTEDEDIAFEFTAQEQPTTSVEVTSLCPPMDLEETVAARDELTREANGTDHKFPEKIEPRTSKEFKFNIETENGPDKNWVFFPLTRPGVS